MSETAASYTMSEDENEFADIIFQIINDRDAKYEREYQTDKESNRVPLEDIKFCSQDFFEYTHMMLNIPIVDAIRPDQNWKATAEHMLDRLYKKGELKLYSECPKIYMLSNTGVLYGRLAVSC